MYLQWLKQIEKEKQSRGRKLQPPATAEDILILKNIAKETLGYELDESYAKFLRITNGIDWNGFSIYATTITPIIGYDDRFIAGFIDINLQYWEVEVNRIFIAFGETGDTRYVFNLQKNEFEEIDSVALDPIETFSSFDELINHLLKQALE